MKTLTMRMAALGAAFLFLHAGAGAQSLGAIARRLQAEKKAQGTKPVKVYTNDNIPHAAAAPTSAEAEGSAAASSQVRTEPKSWNPLIGLAHRAAQKESAAAPTTAAPPPSESAASTMKTKQYWQARFEAARKRLARAEEVQTLYQNELSLLQIQKQRTLDPNQIASLSAQMSSKQTTLREKQAATAKAQKALAKLEKEFQASGAPEAWSKTP
jgi:hypothetical protein